MGLAIQRSFFDDSLRVWNPPQDFPRLHGPISLDLETYDPLIKSHGGSWVTGNDKTGFVTGVALAGPDWQAYYPTRHYGGGCLPERAVWDWLKDELERNPAKDLQLRVYNGLYDRGWMGNVYNVTPRCKVFDGLTAWPLLDENRYDYKLESCAKTFLGEHKETKSLKADAKRAGIDNPFSVMHELPAWMVGPYAEQDARVTYDIAEPMQKALDDDGLQEIFDLETRLVPVLLAMRSRGVRVNVEKAERLGKVFEAKVNERLAKIHELTGHRVDPFNARDIGKMFDSLKIKYARTIKSDEPSVTKDFLKGLEHPVGNLILEARKYSLAKGTFIDGHILGHQIAGRIHAQFHPLKKQDDDGVGGAVTGRFSASNPNLQNLPGRDENNGLKDEIGLAVRGCFEPEPGEQWAAVDYSSQEPRLAVHFAAITHTAGVAPFVQGYREDPRMDFHSRGAAICGLPRKQAKNVTLGKMYGMGGAKLAVSLGLPTEWREGREGKKYEVAGPEAQAIMDRYNEYMPWVRSLSDLATRRAETRGWIKTLCGRKRRFEPIYPGGAFAYKALNCLIQGSAADMTKKSMVELHEQLGVVPLVTVHDELGFSVPDEATATKWMDVMVSSVELKVPVTADCEIGPNWGEAK